MIIVHDIFVCKPGQASKLVKKFQEAMKDFKEVTHFMTDLTGQYNRVIMVQEYASLTAYEERFSQYMQNSEEVEKQKKAMEGYHDMYLTGTREIYQKW